MTRNDEILNLSDCNSKYGIWWYLSWWSRLELTFMISMPLSVCMFLWGKLSMNSLQKKTNSDYVSLLVILIGFCFSKMYCCALVNNLLIYKVLNFSLLIFSGAATLWLLSAVWRFNRPDDSDRNTVDVCQT